MIEAFFAIIWDERKERFNRVFGLNRVPILTPFPQLCRLPDGRIERCYLLDLASISAQQRTNLVEHVAATFSLAVDDVEMELDDRGMPILAKGCSVVMNDVQRWM